MMIKYIVVLIILILVRLLLPKEKTTNINGQDIRMGESTFVGDRQIQADAGMFVKTKAGVLAVLADGIGKNSLGKVSSQVAIDTVASFYKGYEVLSNPAYFFRRAFNQANFEVLKILEGRNGGASLAAVTVANGQLSYALAGDIKVALFRKGELIPLSEGHTLATLAVQAYTKGKMTKQKALWSIQEKRLWNHIGQDGFKEIEMIDVPIRLKPYDKVVLMTKGIYGTVHWKEIEDGLRAPSLSPKETAEKIIDKLIERPDTDKDNSSIYIIEI